MNENRKHKIAVSGATGFIGTHLSEAFREKGWEVIPLGRNDFELVPEDLAKRIDGADVVINLAGAPVVGKRWTEKYKKTMYNSRISVTAKIVDAFSVMEKKPELFISTSAVGFYHSNSTTHTEEKFEMADDFLGHMANNWEKAARRASELNIRTVIFRFGIVLGKDGGALKQMLIPFKAGLGGTIGNGSQDFSWVHIKDLVRAYLKVIDDSSYQGTYNLTSPNPTTNKGLTKALGRALHRPAFLHIPKFILHLQFNEGADVLIKGQRVIPQRLLDSGFNFSFTEIDDAVRDCVS